jgi:diguanylate cyclase (GGDEF)-like protein
MKILNWLAQRPVWFRIPLKVLMVALIGYVDQVTGPEIALSIFYLLPVATTAWIDGEVAGAFVSLVCGVVWLVADLTAGHEYAEPWIPYWNMTVRIGFFAIISTILSRLHLSLLKEQELSRVDSLTGLWNGRYFLELAGRETERCRRTGRPITIAYLDADDFKGVNDTRGHARGDRLLRELGETIKKEVRSQDVPGRMGGDEFALLFPETNHEEGSAALRRLKERLERKVHESGLGVTCSIGAVTFETPPASVEEMIHMADDLMYQAKRGGKGAIRHEVARGESHAGRPGRRT